MTTTDEQPITLAIRRTSTPTREIPAALWIDVLAVLKAHGLDAAPAEVISALHRIVQRTPIEQGGAATAREQLA